MAKEVVKKVSEEKKSSKKSAKFIWFGISIVVFITGVVLAKFGISLENYAVKAVYAVCVLFPLLVAAQKVSCERVDENGKKNVPAYFMYYLCIVLFIVLLPFIFWVNQFVSI